MAEIDLEKFENDAEVHEAVDDTIDDDEKGKRKSTRQHLKVRRAIEDHLEKKRFRKEVDYLDDNDLDFDLDDPL